MKNLNQRLSERDAVSTSIFSILANTIPKKLETSDLNLNLTKVTGLIRRLLYCDLDARVWGWCGHYLSVIYVQTLRHSPNVWILLSRRSTNPTERSLAIWLHEQKNFLGRDESALKESIRIRNELLKEIGYCDYLSGEMDPDRSFKEVADTFSLPEEIEALRHNQFRKIDTRSCQTTAKKKAKRKAKKKTNDPQLPRQETERDTPDTPRYLPVCNTETDTVNHQKSEERQQSLFGP